VLNILNIYETASGQVVNVDKSEVSYSRNVGEHTQHELQQRLGFKAVETHDRYLGLPTFIGRSKKIVFQNVRDRIWKKLKGWKEKYLSRAGKEVLLKAVIHAIPMYAMQCFEMPATLCEEMERMCKNFWWGHSNEKPTLSMISWDSICKPKKEGGLGFRKFKCFNLALLAKQGWRLLHQPDSLAAQVLKVRYFPRGSFWEAKLGHQPSFTWRSILKGRAVLKEGCYWKIGSGSQVKIWRDRWLPKSPNHKIVTLPQGLDIEATVHELIDHQRRCWHAQLIRQCFNPLQAEEILNLPLHQDEVEDTLIWDSTPSGVFTVRSATMLARRVEMQQQLNNEASCSGDFNGRWARIWTALATPRAKNLCWRACRDALPTCVNLYKRGVEVDVICPVCGNGYETTTHIFLDCDLAVEYWSKSPFRFCTRDRHEHDFGSWCHGTTKLLDKAQCGLLATLLWGLWLTRNRWVFDRKREDVGLTMLRCVDSWNHYVEVMQANGVRGGRKQGVCLTWEPPRQGQLKANVDAATGRDGMKGVGVVVRDKNGDVKIMACRSFRANWEVETVEAYAVLYGLQICWQEGFHTLELETDSKQVADALNGKKDFLNYTSTFIHDALNLGTRIPVISFSFASRVTNRVAHELARLALRLRTERIWYDRGPSCVAASVEHDQMSIPGIVMH